VTGGEQPVESITAAALTIPTETPESDGTLEWDATTVLLVEARAGGCTGLGYSYTHAGAAELVREKLAGAVTGTDAMRTGGASAAMWATVRNYGQPGLAATAISAVDIALWDLKACLLGVPLTALLPQVRDTTAIYGSGGFCNYTDAQLAGQLGDWVAAGIPRVKIKTGRAPEQDRHRLGVARSAIGDDVELYADANGAFGTAAALRWAATYGEFGVSWFEEPVTSDDLAGLRLVRERAPVGMDVAAGEYGWRLDDFRRLLQAGAVSCLQADVTRCGGITGFLAAAALCEAHHVDLSAHCAPQISAQVGTACRRLRHLEYFHDHVRIEGMIFDGCLTPEPGGVLRPDPSRAGCGLAVRWADVAQWRSG
jgi:L-alanine-DL-glutamate epimerase-like enolase superfamily enzyme